MRQPLGSPAPVITDEPAWLKGSGVVRGHATVTILRSADDIYSMFRDIESAPLWMERILSVTQRPDGTAHWVMQVEPERQIQWDSELVTDEPGKKIAWRSVDSDKFANGLRPADATAENLDEAGEIVFTDRGDRGTEVLLVNEIRMPGGTLANAWAAAKSRSPRQAFLENLRRFKALAEAGEIPTTKGQPHGPRGVSGGVKEVMYGEDNPEPPGTRVDPDAAWGDADGQRKSA
jgi:uncharacterized membrane protein